MNKPYKRLVRIVSSDTSPAPILYFRDCDSGKLIEHVASAIVYLYPDRVNEIELTLYQMDEQGHFIMEGDDVARSVEKCDLSSVTLTAFERDCDTVEEV